MTSRRLDALVFLNDNVTTVTTEPCAVGTMAPEQAHDMTADRQAKQGRERLLQVAMTLFMKRGYSGVSMQQIAEEAEMTKGAPYYHFRSKDDLFVQVSVLIITQLKETLTSEFSRGDSLADRLQKGMLYVLRSTSGDFSQWLTDFSRLLPIETQGQVLVEVVGGKDLSLILLPEFERASEAGELNRLSPSLASRIFIMLLLANIDHCNVQQQWGLIAEDDLERISEEMVDAFLHGAA